MIPWGDIPVLVTTASVVVPVYFRAGLRKVRARRRAAA